ncbi:MAG: hypothetical protein GY739_17785 [Mesoflavibacter sp.]|nr:hypothetical protein [Mesoflavibacter sp.]
MSQSPSSFEISSYAQEMMCFLGQQLVFEEASKMLEVMKGVQVNPKQIERVCHHYGGIIEDQLQDEIEAGGSKNYNSNEKEQIHYVMTDGAMFLTREEGWKEIKMARIFKKEDNVHINQGRKIITKSNYVAHLGSHKEFFPKLEYSIDTLKSLVFIGDGAKWIWNWANDLYPDSIQILDYYHAAEHLHEFAGIYFSSPDKCKKWASKQKEKLMEDKVEQVIKTIKNLPTVKATLKVKKTKKNLMQYLQNNKKRMLYKTFKEKGLLIGSGAIESAHRHVLQQRLKLSGQRWTKPGIQQLANLRVAYKSNEWGEIVELVKNVA